MSTNLGSACPCTFPHKYNGNLRRRLQCMFLHSDTGDIGTLISFLDKRKYTTLLYPSYLFIFIYFSFFFIFTKTAEPLPIGFLEAFPAIISGLHQRARAILVSVDPCKMAHSQLERALYISYFKHAILPSQAIPLYDGVHWHKNVPAPVFLHVAPFWQGLE